MGTLKARWKEKLFAVDAIGRDRVKTGLRCQPIMPYPRFFEFDSWPFCGIYEDAAVGIEQRHVALCQNFKILAVLEIGPCGSIRERIRFERSGDIEGCPHALPHVAVPSVAFGGFDAR
jgi:hypothetical protein